MNVAARRTPEETRNEILAAAWDLFRQLGARTTIADIAEKLGMSSANIYRFFPSKQALTEAICANQLGALIDAARAASEGRGSAADRIRAMMATLHHGMRDQMLNQSRVHEIVDVAMNEKWPAIDEFPPALHRDGRRDSSPKVRRAANSGPAIPRRLGDADAHRLRRDLSPDADRPMPRSGCGHADRTTSSPSLCARSPIKSPDREPSPPTTGESGAVKPLLVVAGALSALFLGACDAPKQASRETAAPAGAGRANSLRPARARASPAGRRQGAHRKRSGFSRRGQDGAAPRRRRRAGQDTAIRSRASTKRISVCNSNRPRRSAAPPMPRSNRPKPRSGASTTLTRQGWAANADFDKIRAAADQARGAVVKAERAVTLARNALDYTTLKADADGVVSLVAAEPGQVVAAGAPIVRLAHTDEREAAVAIPENLIDRVRANPARVEFWALPGVSVGARLRELSPNADAATRTYPARFSLLDAPESVRLGMSLTVVLTADGVQVARVPAGAIFDAGQGPNVWIVDRATGALDGDAGDRRGI